MENVRIPTDLTGEDTFFSWGPINLSLRQLILIAVGILMWYGSAAYFLQPIFGLNLVFGLFATSWILGVSLALAFVKVRGKSVDVWVAEKLSFAFSPRIFEMRDPHATRDGLNADLDRDDDIEAMLDHQRQRRLGR